MASELVTRSPSFVDGKSQNAQEMRLHVLSSGGGATPLASRGGVRPSGGSPGLVSALPTPVMKVRVNAGIADIPSTSASGGFYRVSWDQVDLDIDVSSAQARTDLVIVEIVDTGTSVATGKVRILKGTSGAGRPSNPVVNAHWMSLGATAVRVGAESGGNIRPQDVTPEALFAVAPGAAIPVRNQAERDVLDAVGFLGLTVERLDTGYFEKWRSAGTWTQFRPYVAPVSNNGGTSGVLAGTAPPAGTPLLTKTWTGNVGPTNASGDAGPINFPGGAFPNGLCSLQVGHVTPTAPSNNLEFVAWGYTLGATNVRAYLGTAAATGLSISASITAIGW